MTQSTKISIVYCATNKKNNKRYIGKTINGLEARKQGHIYTASKECETYFARAIRKYGAENFEWTVLEYHSSDKEAQKREAELIIEFQTQIPENGYNITPGGNGGSHRSIATRKKMGDASRRRVYENPESFKTWSIGAQRPDVKLRRKIKWKQTWKKKFPDIELICKVCGLPFWVQWKRRNHYKTCLEHRQQKSPNWVVKKCITCNVEFQVTFYRRNNVKKCEIHRQKRKMSEETKKKMSEARKRYWKQKRKD